MDEVQSRFVLSSNKVGSVDKHLDRVVEKVELPKIDVLTDAQKLYKSVQKIYERLIHGSITVFDKSFTVHDMFVRNEAELALIVNYRLAEYNRKIGTAKKLYLKLIR